MKHSIWTYFLAFLAGVLMGVLILGTSLGKWTPNPPADKDQSIHFNHSMELEYFRSQDGAAIPFKIRLIYDSVNPTQTALLKNRMITRIQRECMKWTLIDILKDDSPFGTTIVLLIEKGDRPVELRQIAIIKLYGDRDKYIREHFPIVADQMISELSPKDNTDSLARGQQKIVIEAQRIVSEYQQSMLKFEASPTYQKALKEWNSSHPVIGDKKRLELQKAMAQKMIESEMKEIDKLHKQMSH